MEYLHNFNTYKCALMKLARYQHKEGHTDKWITDKNCESRNKTLHLQSVDFQQRCQHKSIRKDSASDKW